MRTVTIKIRPVPGTSLAENKDEAKRLREDKILPQLAAGGGVKLDFSAASFVTQSFVHALISEALRRYGEPVLDRIDFHGCSEDVQQVVLTVVDYTMQAHQAATTRLSAAKATTTD
jgi:hypothetical protein